MLKISRFCLLIVYLSLTKSYNTEYMFDDKGWRPMSSEQIYKGLLTSFQKPNNIRHVDTSWGRSTGYTADDISLLANNAIKLMNHQQVHRKNNNNNKCETQDFAECPKLETRTLTTKEFNTINNKSEHETNKSTRKAKKISDDNLTANSINDFVVHQNKINLEFNNIDSNQVRASNEDIKEDDRQSYEVTENIEILDSGKAGQSNTQDNAGYVYTPPDDNKFDPQYSNLTGTFLNILSKYKINGKDDLRNYELSRSPSGQGTFKPEFIYLPIPIRNIGSYNSLNHLPVNPLLAVLLSQYGYYLPGSYGLHNNYRNLYGYLASNNIHNNKPFGLYKVFSDTDSSNK